MGVEELIEVRLSAAGSMSGILDVTVQEGEGLRPNRYGWL